MTSSNKMKCAALHIVHVAQNTRDPIETNTAHNKYTSKWQLNVVEMNASFSCVLKSTNRRRNTIPCFLNIFQLCSFYRSFSVHICGIYFSFSFLRKKAALIFLWLQFHFAILQKHKFTTSQTWKLFYHRMRRRIVNNISMGYEMFRIQTGLRTYIKWFLRRNQSYDYVRCGIYCYCEFWSDEYGKNAWKLIKMCWLNKKKTHKKQNDSNWRSKMMKKLRGACQISMKRFEVSRERRWRAFYCLNTHLKHTFSRAHWYSEEVFSGVWILHHFIRKKINPLNIPKRHIIAGIKGNASKTLDCIWFVI